MAEKQSETYQKMLSKVEDIVRQLSSGQVDLDEVVSKVEDGYALISKMRDRLEKTKAKIETLRSDFEKQTPQ